MFYSFRIMIAMAILMLITVIIGMRLMYQDRLESSRWFLKSTLIMVPSGLIAVISGWIVAEVGRQPWTVYGVIRTTDIITAHSSDQLLTSMTIFGFSYLFMGITTLVLFRYILLKNS